VTTGGAFHRQGPFVGSGGHYSPSPATAASPFSEVRRPLDDVLTPPWVSAGPVPFTRRSPTHQTSFRATRSLTLACQSPSRPRPPFTLTATLFGALRASLFGTRMLPADFCNCIRRTDEKPGALVSSQGRWP